MMKLINKALLSKVFGMEWPHWTKVVFWSIGLLLMTGLTIKDLRPLVVNYYDDDQNTQVQITLKHPDEEIRAPGLHICIPLANYSVEFHAFALAIIDNIARGTDCAQCAIMASHSYDVWNRVDSMRVNETLEDISRVNELLLELFVAEIAETAVENNSITIGNLSWNRPLVYSLIEYLSRETEMERSLANILRPEPSPSVHQEQFPSTVSEDRLDKLYSVIVSFVCEMFVIYSSGPNYCDLMFTSSSVVIRETFTDSPLFCGQVSLDHLEELTFATITIDSRGARINAYFEKFMAQRKRFLVMRENPLHNTRRSNVIYGTAKAIDAEEERREDVMITYSPQYAWLEDRPGKLESCYGESSKFECESNCYVELMESICECRAHAYRRASSDRQTMNRKMCTREQAALCQQRLRNYSSLFMDSCPKCCNHACHSIVHQWQVNADHNRDNTDRFFALRIEARRQAYLEFKIIVKNSSEDFISQIGGVMSFYLGLSGLSIILFLNSLFDIARNFIQTKRQNIAADNYNQKNSVSARMPVHFSASSATLVLEKELSKVQHEVVFQFVQLHKNGQGLKEKRRRLEKQMDAMTKCVSELNMAVRTVHQAISDGTPESSKNQADR